MWKVTNIRPNLSNAITIYPPASPGGGSGSHVGASASVAPLQELLCTHKSGYSITRAANPRSHPPFKARLLHSECADPLSDTDITISKVVWTRMLFERFEFGVAKAGLTNMGCTSYLQ